MITNTFITRSANGLLACWSAAYKWITACFVCVNVAYILISILSTNEPCYITKLFNYLYIVDNLFIFFTN